MIADRKPVAFLAVASAIREHEVAAQVHRIPSPGDLLVLDESLAELERIDPRAAKVVELRYFGATRILAGYNSLKLHWPVPHCLGSTHNDETFPRMRLQTASESAIDLFVFGCCQPGTRRDPTVEL
jgi:hypothetical protein